MSSASFNRATQYNTDTFRSIKPQSHTMKSLKVPQSLQEK